jgi:peptidoglycan-associated lipoprotein
MISFKRWMKLMVVLFILSFLFVFWLGCTTYKEAVADPVKVTPVPLIVSKPPAAVEDDAEKAKKMVRIREQELREKALREEEARRQKETSEKARFESEDIHFEFDQYILSDTDRQNLNKKAQWLKDFPSAKVLIEGNCDERGSAEYNLALGQKRADAAMNYLTSLGINANRITTISYGKEKPLDPRSTEEAWAKNRRAHFVLKIGISELPPKA